MARPDQQLADTIPSAGYGYLGSLRRSAFSLENAFYEIEVRAVMRTEPYPPRLPLRSIPLLLFQFEKRADEIHQQRCLFERQLLDVFRQTKPQLRFFLGGPP